MSEQLPIEGADFFVVAHTFAAPFVSETIERYVAAAEASDALLSLAAQHKDGIGIFAADAWATANDYHRNRPPLARWRSNKALAVEGARSVYSDGPDKVEIDGEWRTVNDPKAGRIVA